MKTNLVTAVTMVVAILGGAVAAQAGGPGKRHEGVRDQYRGPAVASIKQREHRPHREMKRRGHRPHWDWSPHRYQRKACLWPQEIRRKLRRRGWHGIRVVRLFPRVFVAKATRPNGYRYRIKVNRCRGRVVNAMRVGHRTWY